MQPYQSISASQTRSSRFWVGALEMINISTREYYNQCSVWKTLRECCDTVTASPSMQGNHQII